MVVNANDPRHPVQAAFRKIEGLPECPECGWTLIGATHRTTQVRFLVCLNCPHREEVANG